MRKSEKGDLHRMMKRIEWNFYWTIVFGRTPNNVPLYGECEGWIRTYCLGWRTVLRPASAFYIDRSRSTAASMFSIRVHCTRFSRVDGHSHLDSCHGYQGDFRSCTSMCNGRRANCEKKFLFYLQLHREIDLYRYDKSTCAIPTKQRVIQVIDKFSHVKIGEVKHTYPGDWETCWTFFVTKSNFLFKETSSLLIRSLTKVSIVVVDRSKIENEGKGKSIVSPLLNQYPHLHLRRFDQLTIPCSNSSLVLGHDEMTMVCGTNRCLIGFDGDRLYRLKNLEPKKWSFINRSRKKTVLSILVELWPRFSKVLMCVRRGCAKKRRENNDDRCWRTYDPSFSTCLAKHLARSFCRRRWEETCRLAI